MVDNVFRYYDIHFGIIAGIQSSLATLDRIKVITLDFDSSNPGSIPGRAIFFAVSDMHTHAGLHCAHTLPSHADCCAARAEHRRWSEKLRVSFIVAAGHTQHTASNNTAKCAL